MMVVQLAKREGLDVIGIASGAEKCAFVTPRARRTRVHRPEERGCRRSRRDLEEMLQFVAVNGIDPVIDSVFPFEDAAAAYRHFEDRKHVGKVVISHAR